MEKIRILVVDDKKIIGDLFGFILGYSGHEITVVRGADEAIENIHKNTYDLVFLDIVLPDRDGVEILSEIKRTKPDLPVIMMSGYSVEEKRLQVNRLGAAATLEKPFEMNDVRRVVKEATGKDI